MSERVERPSTELQAENDLLRAIVANSDEPCVYCHLSRADWGKCAQGFPGCDRADDAMLDPGLMEEATQRDNRVSELRGAAKALIDAVQFDAVGIMLPTGFQGGNGGLLSNDTIAKADLVRRVLTKFPK